MKLCTAYVLEKGEMSEWRYEVGFKEEEEAECGVYSSNHSTLETEAGFRFQIWSHPGPHNPASKTTLSKQTKK